MAITVDVANLGTNYGSAGATTITLTTTSAVASGGFIVVGVGRFGGTGVGCTISGGGLTWAEDKSENPGSGRVVSICSAQAPSGLASSTVLTATFVGSPAARVIGAMSLLGVKTSSPVDGTPLSSDSGGAAAWSSGSYTIASGSVIVAMSYVDAAQTNTPTSPSLEAWEQDNAGDNVSGAMEYRIESASGSYVVDGQWGSANASSAVAVAYLAAAAAGVGGLPLNVSKPNFIYLRKNR